MRRTLAVLIGALLAFGTAATAGPLDPPALVVTGTAPAVGTLRLTAPLGLDIINATITAAGRVGGVAIFRGRTFRGGALALPGLDRQPSTRPIAADPTATLGPSTTTLQPGTYSLHLLGEGTVEVRIPISTAATADVSVTAKGRSRQTLGISTGTLGVDQSTASLRSTVTTTSRSWVVALGMYRPLALSQNVALTTCLAQVGRACGKYDAKLVSKIATDGGMVRVFFPAEPGGGKRDVFVTVAADPGAGGQLGIAALTLTL